MLPPLSTEGLPKKPSERLLLTPALSPLLLNRDGSGLGRVNPFYQLEASEGSLADLQPQGPELGNQACEFLGQVLESYSGRL